MWLETQDSAMWQALVRPFPSKSIIGMQHARWQKTRRVTVGVKSAILPPCAQVQLVYLETGHELFV